MTDVFTAVVSADLVGINLKRRTPSRLGKSSPFIDLTRSILIALSLPTALDSTSNPGYPTAFSNRSTTSSLGSVKSSVSPSDRGAMFVYWPRRKFARRGRSGGITRGEKRWGSVSRTLGWSSSMMGLVRGMRWWRKPKWIWGREWPRWRSRSRERESSELGRVLMGDVDVLLYRNARPSAG